MTPLDHLLKYRNTLLQHRRHLAQLAADDDGLNHADRIQKVQGEIEAIDRAIADERKIASDSA
jgi:hypothetical protein